MLHCETFQSICTLSIEFLAVSCTVPVAKKTSGYKHVSLPGKKKKITYTFVTDN